ncbi:hypothetical protein UMZ34_15475 [Halopseudomonas pachastrellae]|nr:hypothetical protein UMZ34_15475 [Halopseudomonas pachastrellae]
MNARDSNVILQRILAYWQWSGMPMDRDTELKALAITARHCSNISSRRSRLPCKPPAPRCRRHRQHPRPARRLPWQSALRSLLMTSLPPTLLPDSTHAQYNWRASARRRRALLLVLVLGQTLAATWLLLAVLPYHGRTWVEVGIAALFALLFTWLSLGFWIAMTGFVLPPGR